MNRSQTACCLAVVLALRCTPLLAHDTWFQVSPASSGRIELALGTGNQFPKQESGIDPRYLVAQHCSMSADAAPALPMKALRNTGTALVLVVPPGARSCWIQLTPFEVTVPPDKVPDYLKEIQASPEQLALWADLQRRGLPWHERYTKHARVEIGEPGSASAGPALPLGMDLRLLPGDQPLRVGSTLNAQVLRDGVPLAGQAIELRSAASPLGIWRRSDAQGRISVRVPLPGHWILRGVDLRLSETVPDQWDSRFVTLAFEVPPAARPGS